MRKDVMTAYVEKLLGSIIGGGHVESDADGDYPIRYRSALYYVRLVGEPDPDVQVFAVAVDGVSASTELLADINEINTRARFARIFHVRDQVLVETDLIGAAIEAPSFLNACETVASISDQVGPQLAAAHGGKTAFDNAKDVHYVAPEPSVGFYL